MLYSKLPVILWGSLATEKSGSAGSAIAAYILENPEKLRRMGIKDLAESCHVGTASVSRFCREIGLADFAELKDMLNSAEDVNKVSSESSSIESYRKAVTKAISSAADSVDPEKLRSICRDIRSYKKVAVFGLFKAEQAAMLLHDDLLLCGKSCFTALPFLKQMEYIENADEDELIIIFSYTGVYFDYRYRKLPENFKKPKIWMISGSENKYAPYVNDFIHFDSKLDRDSHPFQLQFIAGLIAKEYGRQRE